MSRCFVLAFHSTTVSGNTYETNDHVALDEALSWLEHHRIPVLPLSFVVARLRQGVLDSLPAKSVCLTFDDGPDYDWLDVVHPTHGRQPSIGSILKRHSAPGLSGHTTCGTSFVIASRKAREEIAEPEEVEFSDEWWHEAHASGFLEIGSHGWNHLHPRVSEMRTKPELVESFDRICTWAEADLQLKRAFEYIREKAGADAGRLFAYPYGKVSEFVATEYLPRQSDYLAAFTTAASPIHKHCDIWRLPRYVSGWHFRSNGDLKAILSWRRYFRPW